MTPPVNVTFLGRTYNEKQVEAAIYCARIVAEAYALANPENGATPVSTGKRSTWPTPHRMRRWASWSKTESQPGPERRTDMPSNPTRTLERALQLADTITMDDYEVVDFSYVRNGEFNPVKVKFERADEEEFIFLLSTPIELFDGTAYIDDVDGVEHRVYFEVNHPLE